MSSEARGRLREWEEKLQVKYAVKRVDRINLVPEKEARVKFSFNIRTEQNQRLIPAGIPERFAHNNAEADNMQRAIAGGSLITMEGRLRPGRVDTATYHIEAKRPIHSPDLQAALMRSSFFPTYCGWYPKSEKERGITGYVVDLRFRHKDHRPDDQKGFLLSGEAKEGLRRLFNGVWGGCNIFDNVEPTITVNLAGWLHEGKPKQEVVLDNGQFTVVDVAQPEIAPPPSN